MRKVYVAVRDNGSEGYSEPLAVFDDKAMAEAFKAGATAGWATVKVFELELPNPRSTTEAGS